MPHWLVSLPLQRSRRDATWEALQEATQGMSQNSKLECPSELRVGSLDSLMALSDDLAKLSQTMEITISKISRQVSEVGGPSSQGALKVEGLPTEMYLTRFKWDDSKYPTRRPLKESVEKMADALASIEDELKVKVSEYNQVKSQVGAALRKSTGSLAVRDVSSLVKKEQVVDSENLTTLFVIVSKYAVADWKASYERLSNYVVPRSTRLIAEDNDYALVSVVLFKRVLDDFKAAARSKGYQVRDYVANDDASNITGSALEQLKIDVDAKKAGLEQWCKTAYGEAVSTYMHMLVVRMFVESILRYGLPPQFLPVILKPNVKAEAKLRNMLAHTFGGAHAQKWVAEEGAAGMAEGELHPYVSLTISFAG